MAHIHDIARLAGCRAATVFSHFTSTTLPPESADTLAWIG